MSTEEDTVNTDINYTVRAVDTDSQYDEQAKKLLGHKIILAHILGNTKKGTK